jgi:hypothetical protein
MVPQGPQEGSVSVNTLLIKQDYFIAYTGNSGFNGYVVRSKTNETGNFGFTSGYLTNYRCQCSVGDIPTIDATIAVFGDVGQVDYHESDVSSNDFYRMHGSSVSGLKIASPGTIDLNLDEFETNRVNSFDINITIPRKPIYHLGSRYPVSVETDSPIQVDCSFQFEVNDYQTSSMRAYPCHPKATGILINFRDYETNEVITSFNFEDLLLVSETTSSPADGPVTVSATYRTYLTRAFPVQNIPATPTGLSVSSSPIQPQLTVSWYDTSSDEYVFKLEYRTQNEDDYTQIGIITENSTSFVHSGLQSNTIYFYRVRSDNSYALSDYSNVASGKTVAFTNIEKILNVNFQHQPGITKYGAAAVGLGATDIWNGRYSV